MSCNVKLLRRALQISGQSPLSQADAEQLAAVLCVDNEVFPYLLLKRDAYEVEGGLRRALAEVTVAAPSAMATRNGQTRNRMAEEARASEVSQAIIEAVRVGITLMEPDRRIAEAERTGRSPIESDPTTPQRWVGF